MKPVLALLTLVLTAPIWANENIVATYEGGAQLFGATHCGLQIEDAGEGQIKIHTYLGEAKVEHHTTTVSAAEYVEMMTNDEFEVKQPFSNDPETYNRLEVDTDEDGITSFSVCRGCINAAATRYGCGDMKKVD